MPKVMHIITSLDDGGAQSALFRLCMHDDVDEHFVVSLMGEGKYGPLLSAQGTPVTALDMKRNLVTFRGLWRMFWYIRRIRPEALQTWMYHADLAGGVTARLAGRRNIFWGIRHTTLDPTESPRSTVLVAHICAHLSRIVPRRILCCAERSREVHAALGYDHSRMRVIPNGYDFSVFKPDKPNGRRVRQELAIAPEEPVIGFVARYDPQKDHETLLRALAVLDTQGNCPICLLIGTGLEPSNKVLSDRIAALNLGDRVRLLGRRSDIPAVMNALDLHVMSSSFGEAFPNVLAEAMACGTPCVSTDVGDASAIVGAVGRIVPPREPQALAAAIDEMLSLRDTPEWQQRRKAVQKNVADQFSIQRMVERYREAWFGE